jgi:hypothetical protein
MITEQRQKVMILVLKGLGYAPMQELDERGQYVYDMNTGDVLFHDNMDRRIDIYTAFRDWCEANDIIPF